MTVKQIVDSLKFEALSLQEPDRLIEGVYCGDLLSWVMGRAKADSAWITIMSNINVVAVASLADVACVIFAEGTVPDDDVIKTAADKRINLICSQLPVYETAVKIARLTEHE